MTPGSPEPRAVIVMGVSASGKSTLAAALAAALRSPFLEGDDFHAPDAVEKMRAGIPLTDEDRWPWLDRLGRATGAAARDHGIAVASCSALKRAYRDRLRQRIAAPVGFMLLDAPPAELLRRLTSRTGHFMPPELLTSQLATFERPGPDETALTLDATLPPAVACSQAIAWLEEHSFLPPTARG